jgi:hypothetical protein
MRIGIDLGGTKIEAIALDDAGSTLLRRRVPTPAGDYTRILNAVADLVATAEKKLSQQGTVGVAAPGSISTRSGLIKNSNSTILNGKPLDRDLSNRLGRPIRLENDANCFALSEAVDGAGANADLVFGVILGTGVGGGLVIGRKLIVGHNRIAGEWGHNPLPWPHDNERPGPTCYCGKQGVTLKGLDGQRSTLTQADLDALPRVKLSVTQHGVAHVFEGALLSDVLAKVGAPSGKAIRGIELTDVVLIEARDGYKVAIDLAATDSTMRPDRVILADRMDGSALDVNAGPFQLVVEGDMRPARAIRMVSSIRIERVR